LSSTVKDITTLSEKQLSKLRGTSVAMIFQDPMTSLNPVYTIGWQIVEALRAHRNISKEEAREEARRLLEVVGIPQPEKRLDNYPHDFVGMRQRAVIAIGMANQPKIILADEPTTALDVTVQAQVLQTLRTA
jgi:ABC-type dipeptide/oligopeptide/nickel transport system ATPase component